MRNNLMICGESSELKLFLQTCIIQDQPLNCDWFQISEQVGSVVTSLVKSAQFADNFNLKTTLHPKWEQLELLLVSEPPYSFIETEGEVAKRKWVQLIINQAMANGFKGKVCFISESDHLWVYSALRFSGLPASNVFGLGTMPLSETVARLLGTHLDIGSDPIYANVIGTRDDAFIAWSRAQIAGNALLSVIAQDKSLFDQSKLDQIATTYLEDTELSHEIVTVLCLQRICGAIFFNHPILVPLTHEIEFAKRKIAVSEPVVLSKQGVAVMTKLNLSEEENERFIEVKQSVLAQIDELRNK